MNKYTAETLIRLSALITQAGNVAIDPTTLTFKIQDPQGTITDLSGAVQKDGVGNYHVDYVPTIAGKYQYEWIGTGAAQVASIAQFQVSQVPF